MDWRPAVLLNEYCAPKVCKEATMTAALLIAGLVLLVLLVLGGEMLVRGASKLAVSIGISPLVAGLTVVAFGTSSPELAVSIQAAGRCIADQLPLTAITLIVVTTRAWKARHPE